MGRRRSSRSVMGNCPLIDRRGGEQIESTSD